MNRCESEEPRAPARAVPPVGVCPQQRVPAQAEAYGSQGAFHRRNISVPNDTFLESGRLVMHS